MTNVRLENVKKIYSGNIMAVKKVSFEVPDRAFTVLVGPSGCGSD